MLFIKAKRLPAFAVVIEIGIELHMDLPLRFLTAPQPSPIFT
jgi:hypothetical protein